MTTNAPPEASAWHEDDDGFTRDDEYELRRSFDALRDRKISVGSAYRRVQFLPDFVVLWQIGMRKTAIGMLVGYALVVALAILAVNGNPVLIGPVLILFILVAIASWIVFLSLEEWTDDYNRAIDAEIDRLQRRKRR